MTTFTITYFDTKNGQKVYYGTTQNVKHVFDKSEAHTYEVWDTQEFTSKQEFLEMLEVVKEDFNDAEFSDIDVWINKCGIDTTEYVTIFDYNSETLEVLNQWMKAENACGKRMLNKDEKGYYVVLPQKEIKLFEKPERIYITENDAIENHNKEYLSFKYNEMIKDKRNWIVKEVIAKQQFENRCNFLERNAPLVNSIFRGRFNEKAC